MDAYYANYMNKNSDALRLNPAFKLQGNVRASRENTGVEGHKNDVEGHLKSSPTKQGRFTIESSKVNKVEATGKGR